MGKVLLTFDARADQAEKEIKKLQKQIGQMSKEPAKAQRGMQGFGKSVAGVASQFGLVASAAGAVSTIVAAIGDRLERNAKAAKVLGDNLRSIMAGSGLGQHTDTMRNFIQQRQASGNFGMTQEGAMQVLGAYTATRPRASLGELQEMTTQAGVVNQAFGGDIASVGKWATYAGQLQQAGLGTRRSADIAYKLHTGLGQYAPDAIKGFQRIAGASGVDAAIEALPMLMSLGIANRRSGSVDQLRAQFQKNGNEARYGTFENFIANVPLEQISAGVARDTLSTIRGGIPTEEKILQGGGAAEAAREAMKSDLGRIRIQTRRSQARREAGDDPIAGAIDKRRYAEYGETAGYLGELYATAESFLTPESLKNESGTPGFFDTFPKPQQEVQQARNNSGAGNIGRAMANPVPVLVEINNAMQTITNKGAVQ